MNYRAVCAKLDRFFGKSASTPETAEPQVPKPKTIMDRYGPGALVFLTSTLGRAWDLDLIGAANLMVI